MHKGLLLCFPKDRKANQLAVWLLCGRFDLAKVFAGVVHSFS
jgi:hypothetical protein